MTNSRALCEQMGGRLCTLRLDMTSARQAAPPAADLAGDTLQSTVQSLARGLLVIRAFGPRHPRLTLTEVARQTGLTRASARRFLLTLHALGYVAWDGKFFSLTPKILTLGYAYLSSTALPTVLQPALVHLSEQTGESSSGCIRDGDEAVIIARASAQRYAADLGVGSRLPLYCTSLGHVLLAQWPGDELDAYLSRVALVAHTPFTPTQPGAVRDLVLRTRREGHALVSQGLQMGLQSLSVPVRNLAGQVVAAMSITTPVGAATEAELLEGRLPLLRTEAALLQQMLGA